VLTNRRGGAPSLNCSVVRAGAATILPVVAVLTVMSWTSAHAGSLSAADTAGLSDTSCVGGWTTFNCVTRWGPLSNPYVRLVPQPIEQMEKERALARDRKWLARCRPVVEHDRYGVARYRYAAPGCEFGIDED